MRLALYQPDIPQNVGAAIRIAACFSAGVDIIGPLGFAGGEREIKRVAMDYALAAAPVFHDGWSAFLSSVESDDAAWCSSPAPAGEVSASADEGGAEMGPHRRFAPLPPLRGGRPKARIVLLTTKGATDLWDFSFAADDVILLGRESAGVPDDVHEAVDARVRIPLAAGARSLNVAVSGAIALAEGRRQMRAWQ